MLDVLMGCGYLVSRYCEHQVDNFEFFDIRWTILTFLTSGGQFWIFWNQVDNFEFFDIRWTILNLLSSGGQFWIFWHQVAILNFLTSGGRFWIFWHQVDNFEFFDVRSTILCWKDFKLLDQGFPAGWTPPPAMMKMERFENFFKNRKI